MGAKEDQNRNDPGRETAKDHLKQLRWQRVLSYGEERTCSLGLTEADVPRLIEEYRQERRQGK